jgi:DNA recombination protein RmuC
MSIAVALLVGLALGAGVVLLLVRPAFVDRRRQVAAVSARDMRIVELTTRLETVENGLDERMTSAIKEISSQALRDNSAAFTEQAMGRLDQYVKPLKDSLAKVDTTAQTLEQARQRAFGALHQELAAMREGQDRLRTETGNLRTALRAPHVRGRWGEVGLRNIVEAAGLVEHCDFVVQASVRDDEGGLLRPDLVVRLPGGKQIVVDSKVSLDAYLDALDAEDAAVRAGHLARHARQVRDHMQRLAAKGYWRQFEPSPDFVVMVLPDETFLHAAHEEDRSLNEDAWASGVVLASPTLLFGVLRTVAATWQHQTVVEHAREISDLGKELYKRLSTMGAHVAKLGKSIDNASRAYNETVGSLERQVLPQARRFKEHGISGIEPPELKPVETQTRTLVAPELVDDNGQPTLEVLPSDAHAA